MANTVRLKRSAVQGKAPVVGDLSLGELAVNTYDGKLYTKKNDGSDAIVEIGGDPSQWTTSGSDIYYNTGNVATTGTSTAASFIPTSSTVPTNGIYLPSANNVALATNGAQALYINADGDILVADGNRMEIDEVRARDGAGLKLFDDAGAGIFVEDGGNVGVGTSSPDRALTVNSSSSNINYVRLQETTANTPTDGGSFIELGGTRSNGNYGFYGGIFGGRSNQAANNSGYLAFYADNSDGNSLTERMRIDSSGNVGIGTTSPNRALEINGSDDSNNFEVSDSSGGAGLKIYNNTTANEASLGTTSTSTELVFDIGGFEAARIDDGKRLLVGTSSGRSVGLDYIYDAPASLLSIESAGGQSNCSIVRNRADLIGPYFSLGKSRGGAIGSNALVANNDYLGVLQFCGADGVDLNSVAASITCFVDGTPGANDMPGRLVFSTTADGASSPTERMRIRADGRTVLGDNFAGTGSTTSHLFIYSAGNSSNTSNVGLETYTTSTGTRYAASFSNPNGVVGSISTSGSATAYNTSSDYRLKENVVSLIGAADRLNQLQAHRFNFISDPDTTVDGFIAHEAQAVVPECVTGTKDEVDAEGNPVYQGIDQSKLVPLLTAALQEALAEIESLKARVTALEP